MSVTIRRFLSYSLFGMLSAFSFSAQADMNNPNDLQPRAEVGIRAGTQRSVMTTELWAPLAQQRDRVFYTDLRFMGDDMNNREGNFGFGYRQVTPSLNSVLGGHAWIDRRHTSNNSDFHQLTVGAEVLGDPIDARFNVYIPLNSGRNINTGPVGSANPFLAGNGIFFNTNGSIFEQPLYGTDAELGYRLPILQNHFDAIRVYGGAYSFFRNNADTTTGYRARIEANITADVSVGGRFQHDNSNGDQGFLEATLRFPFKSKKSFQKEGLRARLDESPQRDVDIVTSGRVTAVSVTKAVQNTVTGTQQRVLYVDNSAAAGGDGSKDNPFNSLADAQSALQNYDVLFINRGTGTTLNMDQGLNITQTGVQVIGSGSNFVYDSGHFTTGTGQNFNGSLLSAAGLAPVITNTLTSTDDFTGNAIYVTGGDITISGVNTSNATGSGVFVYSAVPSGFGPVNIHNVTADNNAKYGIGVQASTAGIGNVTIANVTTNNNNTGIFYHAVSTSTGQNVFIDNAIANVNTANGINVDAFNGSHISDVQLTNIQANNNGTNGLIVQASFASSAGNVTLDKIETNQNQLNGTFVTSNSGGIFDNVNLSNITASDNVAGNGLSVEAQSGATMQNITLSGGITTNNNGLNGTAIRSFSGSMVNDVIVNSLIATGNDNDGLLLYIQSGSSMNDVTLSNITSNNNVAGRGIAFENMFGGNVHDLRMTNIQTNANGTAGLSINNSSSGLYNSIEVFDVVSNFNGTDGIKLVDQYSGSTPGPLVFDNLTASDNTGKGLNFEISNFNSFDTLQISNGVFNNNGSNGLKLHILGSKFNDLNLSNITTNTNLDSGINIATFNSSLISRAFLSQISSNGNTGNGFELGAYTSGVINNITFSNMDTNGNTQNGMYFYVYNGGILNNAMFDTVVANTNGSDGIHMEAQGGTGKFDNIYLQTIRASGNTGNGLSILSQPNSSVDNVSISSNNFINNGGYGVVLNNEGATAFNVDMGGGAFNAFGNNNVRQNALGEILVDLDGGTLSAQHNYWGDPTGLPPGKVTLEDGSNINSSNFLTTDSNSVPPL